MCILVTGGAGYIGSHTTKLLLEKGYKVIVLDDLSTGHREAVLSDYFYEGDIADNQLVQEIVRKHNVSSVVHFAAKSLVGESVIFPDLYFYENCSKSLQLFTTSIANGVKNIVFSSTAAVYGIPQQTPITETQILHPINPYGESKLVIEKMLHWLAEAYDIRWGALRYFNAAGADLDGVIGEHHENETHLIPLVLKTALGQRETIGVYGTDYDTLDGTCIRDYLHVMDLAEAHLMVLEGLENGLTSGCYNLGTGKGYSVKEIIDAASKITGIKIPVQYEGRREGDPPILIADSNKIQNACGWRPRYSDIDTIISSAWKWHSNNRAGFSK